MAPQAALNKKVRNTRVPREVVMAGSRFGSVVRRFFVMLAFAAFLV